VLAFANVMHLLADELSGLRARGLSFALVLLGSLDCFLIGHESSFAHFRSKSDASVSRRLRGGSTGLFLAIHKKATDVRGLREQRGPDEGRELRVAQVSPLYESVPPALYGGTEL
jgi:hypothetical protein